MAITKVSSGVISANAVTATIVAENVITSSEIATDGVGTLQIADGAVTSAKLDTNIDIAGTLDVTGVLTADSNVVIAGNLTVNGSTVTNSSTNTTIEDALIELGTGTTGTPANDAGIIIERGDSNNAFMGFDESEDKFIVATTTATGSSTGDLTLTAAPLVTGALTASGLSYPTSDGSANQVIKTDGSGNLSFVTAITDGAVVHNYTATGDGSTVTFDTGINPQDEVNTWVHIDGVYQNKSEYSYNGTEITFTTAPDSGAAIDIITGNQNGFSTADSVLGVYSTTTTDTDTYDTGLSATNENNVNIFIEGVYQPKSTYTWSGSTITFDANTPTGLALEVIASKTLTSGAVVTASITDDAVTTAKIADNAITSAKIVNNSITGADISATTNIVANTFTGALTGNVTGNVTGNLTGTIQTAAQPNITSVGTLTGLTTTGDINLGDNDKAIFGAGSDLQIYHSGSHSFIDEQGTGGLITRTGDFYLRNSSDADMIYATSGGVVKLYYAGLEKLSTTSTGIDVTGTVTADGLTVASDTDVTVDIGRAKIGNVGFSDFAGFAHRDNAVTGSYALLQYSTGETYLNAASGRDLNFRINNSNVGMFTSSGNLLVGTTSTGSASGGSGTSGININANGGVELARSANPVLFVNRTTSNGDIVQFRKDGTTVGSISTFDGEASFGRNNTGIMPVGSGSFPRVIPTDHNSDVISDGAIDLGYNNARWKDLYLSGGAYLGGTGSANHLDDYEEGTWTPTVASANGTLTLTSYQEQSGRYTKIGRLVFFNFQLGFVVNDNGTGSIRIGGLPFPQANDAGARTDAGVSAYNYDYSSTTKRIAVEGVSNQNYFNLLNTRDNTTWEGLDTSTLVDGQTYYFKAAGFYTS